MTFICVLLFLIVGWWSIINQKYRNFYRYLKLGDPVNFYIGEEKTFGRIEKIGTKYIHVVSFGRKMKILPGDAYPVITFRYKPYFD